MSGRYFKAGVVVCMLVISFVSHAQIVSNFSANDEGWTIGDINGASPMAVTYNPTNGNPGGHLSFTTASGLNFYWYAPAKFKGNRAYTSYGETLTFDLQSADPQNHASSGDVMLGGGSLVIFIDLASLPAVAPGWKSYSIKLDETAGWHIGSIGGASATREQIIQVLTSLTDIRIFVQYKNAANVLGRLDNVVMNVHPAATPPPAITSITPLKAAPGSTLTINGSGFDATASNNTIWFGGVKAFAETSTTNQLTVKVPSAADYGRVLVTNLTSHLGGTSQQFFTPTFATGGGATIIQGSFAQNVSYNRTMGYMAHGDLNGDGKHEMILSRDNFISVFENISTTGTLDANSFGPRLDLNPSSPDGSTEIGVIDLDNDGKLDIFVAIRDAPDQGRVVVFRNIHTTGSITAASFAPTIDVTIPPYTASTAHAADLDGDGRPELLSWGSSCAANPVYILQNISTPGDIKFTASFSLPGFSTCGARYSTADLDGDGKQEIVAGGDNNIRIFRNTSTPGALSFEVPFDFGQGAGTTAIGDLDNDNKPEIVYAASGLKVFKNISTPGSLSISSFQPAVNFVGGQGHPRIADINGDGKPEVITGVNGGMGVFQNIAVDGEINSGSFKPYVIVDGGGTAASELEVADFDNDGKPDLLSNNSAFAVIGLVKNVIAVPPVISSISATSAPAGSTVTITGSNFSPVASDQTVYFGQVKGTVTNATTTSLEVVVPVSASHDQVSVALNGYTMFSKEFFTPTFGGGVDFSPGSFAAPYERTIGNPSVSGLLAHDFDADGRVDILVDNTNAISVLRVIGSVGTIDATTFQTPYNIGTYGQFIKVGDFDGDGKTDLTANNDIVRNISDSSLPNPVAFDPFVVKDGSGQTPVEFSDFRDLNNDGKIEISFAGNTPNVYINGNQTKKGSFLSYQSPYVSFRTNQPFSKPDAGGSLVAADFDDDGFNDLIATNPTSNTLSAYLNKKITDPISTNLFNGPQSITASPSPSWMDAGDFDGDGKVDLVVSNSVNITSATISVFRNISTTGNIAFTKQDFPAGPSPSKIAFADMDGDGKIDIVVNNQGNVTGGNTFSIFRNKSTTGVLDANSFASRIDYATITSPRGLAIADIDGDMRPEVIITRVTANMIAIFKNLVPAGPSISFTKEPVNATACENGEVSFTIVAAGASNLQYNWQKFDTTTNLFEDISANATYSGVNTATLTVQGITAGMNAGIFRCRVNGTGASEKISGQGTLTVSPAPGAPLTSGATACKGSSLLLTASGGVDGNYRWFDSPTSQQSINAQVNSTFSTPVIFTTTTFYAGIANAAGCISVRTPVTATISPITKPAITSSGTMLCGVNQVDVNGPAGFAAYNWSNGASTQNISVSFTGSYSLIVEDVNGCQSLSSDPIVVSAGSVPKPVIQASKSRLCSATDEVILSGPAGASSYEWSDGSTAATLSVKAAGIFSLRVTNSSGCKSESSDDFEVELGAEKPTISVGTDVLASSPAKTYQWYFGDFKIPEGTKQFLKYNPFQYGSYSVSVTDFSDCAATSNAFVNLVTAAEDNAAINLVHPNPVGHTLYINTDIDEARLFDATGKLVLSLEKGENDVSQLSKGVYFVRVKIKNEFKTVKIIK